jgi:hypothetical protein
LVVLAHFALASLMVIVIMLPSPFLQSLQTAAG